MSVTGEYAAKNYTEQGGDVTHIGGKLVIDEGGSVEGMSGGGSGCTLPAATEDTLGGVKAKTKTDESVEAAIGPDGKLYVPAYPAVPKIARQPDAAGEDAAGINAAFNALLSALKDAGLMESE